MKLFSLIALLTLSLAACSGGDTGAGSGAVGGDKDEHGCIASAGYSWCAATQQCERPWELAEKEGFENTEAGFGEFCGN